MESESSLILKDITMIKAQKYCKDVDKIVHVTSVVYP